MSEGPGKCVDYPPATEVLDGCLATTDQMEWPQNEKLSHIENFLNKPSSRDVAKSNVANMMNMNSYVYPIRFIHTVAIEAEECYILTNIMHWYCMNLFTSAAVESG